MATWNTVVKLGKELPNVEEGIWFRTPALKVKGKGKSFCRMKEDGENIVVLVPLVEKEFLMAAVPDVFHETDHYKGYPAMLVRLKRATAAQLRERLYVAWQQVAPKTLLKSLQNPSDARPNKQKSKRA